MTDESDTQTKGYWEIYGELLDIPVEPHAGDIPLLAALLYKPVVVAFVALWVWIYARCFDR